MLPSDLWEMIVLYLNDPISCQRLYTALPIHIQKRIKPIMDKHILALSVTMAYDVYHPELRQTEIIRYRHGKQEHVRFLFDRVKTIQWIKGDQLCIVTKNGIFHRFDRNDRILQSGPLLPHLIDHAVFHPDGTKLVLLSGSQVQLWLIGGHMMNFTTLVYPIAEVMFHPTKPLIFFSRIYQNNLLEVYEWNYYTSLVQRLPIDIQDEYILAEQLLDEIMIAPLTKPIRFSKDGEFIEGICRNHLKRISLHSPGIRPFIYLINKTGITDFIWNTSGTILYYAVYDLIKNYRFIYRSNLDVPIYSTPCVINRLVGLVVDDTKLIFVEDHHVYRLDLETGCAEPLYGCNSESLVLKHIE